MSRKPSGSPEAVKRALETTRTTQSAIGIRRALAVALPVMHGLSLKDTAKLVGRSEAWVAKERLSFIQELSNKTESSLRGGRRNQLIPADEEDAFMDFVCQKYIDIHSEWRSKYSRGWATWQMVEMSFAELAHRLLEEKIQRKTTRTTVYNIMARTGKRRFVDYTASAWVDACLLKIR